VVRVKRALKHAASLRLLASMQKARKKKGECPMKTLALGLLAGLALATSALAGAPEPTKPVDPAKFFTGRWYEIGRKPQMLTNGCVAGWTEYTRGEKDRLMVLDACYDKTPSGKLKTIGGPADMLDETNHAKIRVHYRLGIIPIGKDYWVLDHDDDYSWFLEASPSFDELWIYTRAANPAPELVQELIKKAQGLGYDTTKLEFPTQTGK
jgi:apolipoprotein D and lipocalin family protein